MTVTTTEEVEPEVAEEARERISTTTTALFVDAFFSTPIVQFSFVLVTQNLVSCPQILELFVSIRVFGISVRMKLFGQFAIGFFDLIRVGSFVHTQYLVKVTTKEEKSQELAKLCEVVCEKYNSLQARFFVQAYFDAYPAETNVRNKINRPIILENSMMMDKGPQFPAPDDGNT